jgi:hypothetical protein
MMQPIGGDNTEATSALITPRRQPFALRHPRLVASLWFGTFGGMAGAVITMIASRLSPYVDQIAAAVWILGCFTGMIAGAMKGAVLLQKDGLTAGDAIDQSGKVVMTSHLLLGVIPLSAGIVSAIWNGPGPLFGAVIGMVILPIASLVVVGAVTYPLGYLGGWLLFKYRERIERPRGCRLHGYRTEEISHQIQCHDKDVV